MTSGPPDCLAPSILATPVAADFSKTEISRRCEEGISYRRDARMRGWNWMILPTFCAGFVVCWKWPMINFWNLDYQVFASLVSCHKLTVSTFTCYMNSINFPGTISIHEGPWTCTASSGRKSPAWTIALWDVTGSMVVCTSPTGWMVVVTCRRGQLARLSELLDVWNPVWVKDFFIRFSERYVCCWHMFCFTILFKGIQTFWV